jgi:hypothetical protein
MEEKINEFELFLNQITIEFFIEEIPDFDHKIAETKWSKKEILGHLIDSGSNNLQRFTEIQFLEKPYKIRPYNQDELVKANNYQNKNSQDLLELWLKLNLQILHVIKNQTQETLTYQIQLPNGNFSDFKFLIEDYFNHFYYHLKQINTKWI